MPEPTPQHGPSSIAALAGEPTFDDAHGPWTVHGIALGEGDETVGLSGQRVRWPRDALEAAADKLGGKKLTDGRNHDDLESGQPPTQAIVGEVTAAAYDPGVGIVYEAEVDDPDIARLIHRDRVDVSPVVAFDATETDDEETLVAEEIQAFRDLAVVAEGAAPSNDISPGTAPQSVAAAAMAGLAATFASDDEGTTGDDGADGSEPQSTGGPDKSSDDHTDTVDMTDDEPDLSDSERELLAAVDDPETAIAVLQEYQGREEPRIVDDDEYEAMQAENREVRKALALQLADDEFAAEAMADKYDTATLKERVLGDDESLGEALQQSPETGSVDEGDTPPADDDPEVEALLADLGTDDREEAIDVLQNRHEMYSDRGWEANAVEAKQQLDTLGVEVTDE